MALHGSHFLQQFQWIEPDSDLAQLAFDGLGERFRLQKPLIGGFGWVVALAHLRALPVFLR